MEGRRRRAQRLTQNMQDQPEDEAQLQQMQPELAPQAEVVPSEAAQKEPEEQTARRRARRAPQQEMQAHSEQTAAREDRPIPKLPKIEEGEPAARIKLPQQEPEKQPGKKGKRLSAAKTLAGEYAEKGARASAEGAKMALRGIGGVLIVALMLGSEAGKKLCALAKRLPAAAKETGDKLAAKSAAPVQAEYELELIQPKDYHGRGQAHTQKEANDKAVSWSKKLKRLKKKLRRGMRALTAGGKGRTDMINRALSAVLICVALFSAWQIGAIITRSIRTHRLNDSLSQQRAAIIEERGQQDDLDERSGEEEDAEAGEDMTVYAPIFTPEPTVALLAEPEEAYMAAQIEATPAPDVVTTTKYHTVGGDALPEMEELYNKNHDLTAWIQIPDVLDLPVVYRNNSYYLYRDFNKQKNTAGTIFLDENHPFKEKTQNLLLHGHNMKDGTMFGRLAQYLYDDTYLRNHPFIYFDTLWRKEQYVIVAVLDVSLNPGDPRFFNYFTHDTFSSDSEFEMYIRQLQLRSYYAIPIDVEPSDALLTLSTCLDDDRLVIVARRLRPNETRSQLRTLIRMATKQ